MKQYLSLLFFSALFVSSVFSQTQFIDKYSDLVVTSANTIGTNGQGWATVADVRVDSVTQKLAVLKFDMCGDLEWSFFYGNDSLQLHHGEILQHTNNTYHITCSDVDLSKGPTGVYMINLAQDGSVLSAVNHSREGTMISGYFIGTDLDILDTTKTITEYESDNGNKGLVLFDEDYEVEWSKSYDGLPNMTSPMGIETINDSMVFVTNTFQVAMLDTAGEVLWSMKNDSVVIWPEIAYLEDNTIGILVSPLRVDSAERADGRRYIHLVTFPQGTPNPVMHEGDIKLLDFFPELHAVQDNFVVVSLDSIPDIEGYAQTFTTYDKMGALMDQRYLADMLSAGAQEVMPFMGFDFLNGSGYVTYADRDSSVYFGKIGAGLEVEDPMSCMTETRDSIRPELLPYWETIMVTVDSIETTVDSVMILPEPMDSIIMERQCENEIPDGEVMQSICPGDSVLIGGEWIKEEGTYMDTMTICDEDIITTYMVMFIELEDVVDEREFCPGDTIIFGTQTIFEPGTYTETFMVCGQEVDTIRTYRFAEGSPDPPDLLEEFCPGDTVIHIDPVNDTILVTSDTSFSIELPDFDSGCPDSYTITQEFIYRMAEGSPDPPAITDETCPGDTIVHNDQINGTLLLTRDTSFSIELPDNASGCPDFYSITQEFVYRFNAEGDDFKDLIPNAFTPNSDGMNDRFMVKQDTMLDLEVESFEMNIYNRWGNLVFTTNDFTSGWDGRHDGEDPVSEVYLYIIDLRGRFNGCDINRSYTGDVTLIR